MTSCSSWSPSCKFSNALSILIHVSHPLTLPFNPPSAYLFLLLFLVLPGGSDGKESPCNAGDPGLIPGSGKIPWRRKWQHTPVFLLGESHGQRSLVCSSPWGRKKSGTTERLTLIYLTLMSTKSENNVLGKIRALLGTRSYEAVGWMQNRILRSVTICGAPFTSQALS